MENYCLDQVDYSILKLLQTDARITYDQMARRLHRSKSPLFERVKRLEQMGYIQSYVTLIDYSKLRDCLMSFINIRLTDHSISALRRFSEAAAALEEVMECSHLTGGSDFLLKVVTRNMEHYNEFLFHKLGELDNIASFNSSMVMGQSKSSPVIPF
ncbi:Lrp/AsnC family transcriptional regulator [Pedobacter paludis]|uniref:AsnC family transcriptional regulator n=1 Tax=Pedobacter paludis TaxID=2203212 RepID=A0A317F3L7_9SPHI|nr:Lrp/AsnC family transcriptional regulator [Pedobacter paludis]PWS32637.1 AsnC family transcriptional regulator [Pedobacter paludis]